MSEEEPCTYPLCPTAQWAALNCRGCTSEARKRIRLEQEAIKSRKYTEVRTS